MPAPSCRRPSRPSSRPSTSGSARCRPAFGQKLLAAAKAGALHVDRSRRRLPAFAAADCSRATGRQGPQARAAMSCRCRTRRSSPRWNSLTSHDTRQKLLEASLNRAEHGDANDTRAIVSELAQLRAKKAALFGAANFADYTLYDQMAKDRATAVAFLDRLAPPVAAKERTGMVRHRRAREVAGRDIPADRGRLELLCRADPQAALRAQQRRPEALFRVQQGADGRRVLRRQPALRADLQRAEGHPDLEPGHAGIPG